jgi:membrane associated rhomboid family serine protease
VARLARERPHEALTRATNYLPDKADMGLYDREYSRGPEPGFHVTAPTTATMQLALLTGAVYVAQLAFGEPFERIFALRSDWFTRPWQVYQLLSYGFLHDPNDISHILLNMLVFWMFGRELEQRYGRTEFIAFYLAGIVLAGAIWSAIEASAGAQSSLIGASGGVSALFALFALNFPHRQVLFMFVLPMPMWVAALIALVIDVRGAMVRSGNIACTAHLAGATFGFMYYRFGWRLGSWITRLPSLPMRRKPRLRVHAPNEEDELNEKVDAILQKIQEQGQDSLTWNERRLLEKASRRYQQKRK